MNLTAGEVAKRCGMSKSYLCQIERGDVSNPTVETLARITDALGIDLVLTGTGALPELGSLTYSSPVTVSGVDDSMDEGFAHEAARLVLRTLRDEGIPYSQRNLLKRQIVALVETVKSSSSDYAEPRSPES